MIQIGQKVHCDLEGGRDGMVTAIHGSTRVKTFPTFGFRYTEPNAYVTYDIVFMDGSEARNITGAALTGNQWRVLPAVVDADEIESLLARATAKHAEEAERLKKDAAELAVAVAGIRSDPQFRHLRQAGGCALGSRLAMMNLRSELRLAFPDAEFSVGIESRDSLSVRWAGGPAVDTVQAITAKHQARTPWTFVFAFGEAIFLSRADSFAVVPGAAKADCRRAAQAA